MRIYSPRRLRGVGLAIAGLTLTGFGTGGLAQDFGPVTVPGTAVIFDPDDILSASQLAALRTAGPLAPVPAVKAMSFTAGPGQALTISASGTVGCCSVANVGPDGYAGDPVNIAGIGPISGFSSANGLPLVGVFTNGHPAGTAPADYVVDPSDPTIAPPDINQVFFIGDGLTGTGSGSKQVFKVPPDATQLWLGFVDGGGFQGPPANYGDNPGSPTVSGELVQTNCSQLVTFKEHSIYYPLVRTPYLVLFTQVLNDRNGFPSVFIGAGDINTSNPGIIIDAKGTLVDGPDVDPLDRPETVIVQNLVEWSGYAEYGDDEDETHWVKEWRADVYPEQPTPLQILDPDVSTGTYYYPGRLIDAPTVHAPLEDLEGRTLRRVNYTKKYKAYIGCRLPSDPTFHPVEVVTWRARYKAPISYPIGKTIFLGHTPIRAEDPEPALNEKVQTEPPTANCVTNYLNFNGHPTNQCD
jgi:hypothetical protein